MKQTRTLLANLLSMSRDLEIPDTEVGHVINLYTMQLDAVMYLDEMQHVVERDKLIETLRDRGVRSPGIERGSHARGVTLGPRPRTPPGSGDLSDYLVPRPPSADGLDEMSMEDLQALIARAEVIKPV